MKEHEECGIINNKVKVGEQCVYSKTHICNGEKCKPYPCGYFTQGKPYDGMKRVGVCQKCAKPIRVSDEYYKYKEKNRDGWLQHKDCDGCIAWFDVNEML